MVKVKNPGQAYPTQVPELPPDLPVEAIEQDRGQLVVITPARFVLITNRKGSKLLLLTDTL